MLAVHVDQVADVAERVERSAGLGERLDIEVEFQQPLALILARLQSEQHHASAHWFSVVKHGKMLDLEPALFRRVHRLGESSTA